MKLLCSLRDRLKHTATRSWGDQIAASRKYVSSLTPAERVRHVKNMILVNIGYNEQTDAYLKSSAEARGFDEATYEEAVGELLDEGKVRATVIDGGKGFGFLPGLVRVKDENRTERR